MKKINIKVQSAGDIITNSSSECYTIKSDLDLAAFDDMWFNFLLEHHYINEEGTFIGEYPELAETYLGNIYKDEDGLHLDFPVLCNINEDLSEWLSNIFGAENVTFDW